MNTLFDVKLTSGEIVEGVYFLQYQKPIKAGKGNHIVMWANDSLRCFNKDGVEQKGINIIDSEMVKAYDQETGKDVTEFYNFFAKSYSSMSNNAMYDRLWFARDVIRLED